MSLAASPRSEAVAPAGVSVAEAAEEAARLSPEPPPAGRSSAQSDIDRLLQETLGNQITAEQPASPTPATGEAAGHARHRLGLQRGSLSYFRINHMYVKNGLQMLSVLFFSPSFTKPGP